MRRFMLRLVIFCIAILLVSTAIVASEQGPEAAAESGKSTNAVAVADQAGIGLEVALASIVLGGGMVFLFRPKRRAVTQQQ